MQLVRGHSHTMDSAAATMCAEVLVAHYWINLLLTSTLAL
jgi:hypothetical protein